MRGSGKKERGRKQVPRQNRFGGVAPQDEIVVSLGKGVSTSLQSHKIDARERGLAAVLGNDDGGNARLPDILFKDQLVLILLTQHVALDVIQDINLSDLPFECVKMMEFGQAMKLIVFVKF